MKVKSGEQQEISENMALFETQWNAVKIDSKQADEVDQRLLDVKNALEKGYDMKQVKGKLSSLSESLVAYDTAQNPVDTDQDKKQLQALIPFIDEMKVTIQREDAQTAQTEYQQLLNKWTETEKVVREESVVSYGEIEKYMAFVRIAITKRTP